MSSKYPTKRVEFHILQSFPVTCLNRDDVGAPKTAMVGGVTRARVSSQCWKRQVRLALRDSGVRLGLRTKHVEKILAKACADHGADADAAGSCGEAMAKELVKDTLLFLAESEAMVLAEYAKENDFDASKLQGKELAKRLKGMRFSAVDALDIALFGRMVANITTMNVEAAASFSHAISTHQVSNELEFFTALDDISTEQGSAHMGTLEFNSATYYRYISVDLAQLADSIGADQVREALEYFTKALFVAVPSARQTTQSGASPWEFARVLVRTGQRLQVSFETPVRAKEGGYLEPSIDFLKDYLDKKEKLSGSLFGKVASYDWGRDSGFSIDNLVSELGNHV